MIFHVTMYGDLHVCCQEYLEYLPPYAPHLNPVELCFNILRIHISGEAPRNEADLRAALEEGLQKLTPAVCSRLFQRVLGPSA